MVQGQQDGTLSYSACVPTVNGCKVTVSQTTQSTSMKLTHNLTLTLVPYVIQ